MKYEFDLVIIGAGSAGMVAGEAAPKMGVRTALVERARIGGDCLWTGCVPSKALLASAKAAYTIRHADKYGLPPTDLQFDTKAIWQRIRETQAAIAESDDSPEKFTQQGVELIYGGATLADAHTVRVGKRTLTTRYILICTGSRPADPPEGLAEIGYLSSESLFELERPPASLLIVGAGPTGVEMAQGLCRLGVNIVLLEQLPGILEREEPAVCDILMERLREEGVDVCLDVCCFRATREDAGKVLHGRIGEEERSWSAEDVFLAAGRKPNIESIELDHVGIKTGPRGIIVDEKMRTSVKSIYAAGDCAGRFLFTHSAAAEAVIALRNMFYPGSQRAPTLIPWTTFTDPELAHVGMTSREARERLGERGVRVFEWGFDHSDRARTDSATEGKAVIVTDSRFRIIGAHILAPSASEMIGQLTLAISRGARLTREIVNLIQVYPTFSTSISQLAAAATYGELEKPIFRMLRRLNDIFSR